MELKSGYKQTEVGIIPKEWKVKTLRSLTSLLTNGFVGRATSAYVDNDDGVLYIQGYNILENGFNFHGIKRVSKSFHARNQKSCLQPGDLLTIQTGDIGVTAVVPDALVGSNCHALVISRLDKQVSEPNFYGQYFNSERGRVAFKEIETGSTMKHLNVGDMKRLLLPSPPVEEQRTVAAVLTDVDELIRSLEQHIAKRRDLKQAAMQELLTGKKRLPGFESKPGLKQAEVGIIPKDWKVAKLSAICSMKSGVGITSVNIDRFSEYPCYGGNGLRGYTKTFTHDGNYALIGRQGALCGNVLGVKGKFFASEHAIVVTSLEQADIVWLTIVLSRMRLNQYSESSAQPGLSVSKLLSLDLALPSTKTEQTAIATTLIDMDTELVALQRKRDKVRAIKQGMMQELLSGRIRLV